MGRFDFKTRTGQISWILQIPFDLNAQDFFNRVTAAGGTLTSTEQSAINNLVLNMKSAGIWNSMKAIYPMVGASAASCSQNLKSSSFTGTFSSGWTFASTGATPNGTSAYMDTNLSLVTAGAFNNLSFSYYSRTNNTVPTGYMVEMGRGGGSAVDFANLFLRLDTSNNFGGSMGSISVNSTNTNSACFAINSRTSSTLQKIYKNGSIIASSTSTQTTTVIPNLNIFIGSQGGSTIAYGFSNRQCAFSSIGDGLTDTQASDFYTVVQAFQTTLGRQV